MERMATSDAEGKLQMLGHLKTRLLHSWKTTLCGVVLLLLLITGTLDNVFSFAESVISGASTVLNGLGSLLTAYLFFKKEKAAVADQIKKDIENENPHELARGFDRATDRGMR